MGIMFTKLNRRVAAGALLLAVGGAAAAGAANSVYATGSVSGWNTIDHLLFAAEEGQVIHYYVSGDGNGTNTLTVKFQQQKSGGGWKTLETKYIDMPSGGTWGTFTVDDEFNSVGEQCRIRFSRDLGTQAIDWTVEYLY
jgi:hypothetical protein